jgi:NTP pyrophosphatase (non-canonical NTP hydrolase)
MLHPWDVYKNWQPSFAAYEGVQDITTKGQQAAMEMTGEAAEVLSLFTKANRKFFKKTGSGKVDREKLVDELGDTLWGLVGLMNVYNISLYELTQYNMNKLEGRYKSD